jgi:hypothetical protein
MSKKLIGTIIGIILIGIALLPSSINLPIPNPQPVPEVNLDLSEPTKEILEVTNALNKLISNKKDRTKIAVFNYCFSNRVNNYETDVQKLNDIYVAAAKYYFGDSLKGKYADLDIELTKLFINILGEDNHVLSEDEKVNIKNTFGGLAWSLIQ